MRSLFALVVVVSLCATACADPEPLLFEVGEDAVESTELWPDEAAQVQDVRSTDGEYVGVNLSGLVKSAEGTTWNYLPDTGLPENARVTMLAKAGDGWVGLVGRGEQFGSGERWIATSPDLRTWDVVPLEPVGDYFETPVFTATGNAVLLVDVVVPDGADPSGVFEVATTGPPGGPYVEVEVPGISTVAAIGDEFVALGGWDPSGSSVVYRSGDGRTWEEVAQVEGRFPKILSFDDTLVLAGENYPEEDRKAVAHISRDRGATWVEADIPHGLVAGWATGVVGPAGVVVLTKGSPPAEPDDWVTTAWFSADGASWTQIDGDFNEQSQRRHLTVLAVGEDELLTVEQLWNGDEQGRDDQGVTWPSYLLPPQ